MEALRQIKKNLTLENRSHGQESYIAHSEYNSRTLQLRVICSLPDLTGKEFLNRVSLGLPGLKWISDKCDFEEILCLILFLPEDELVGYVPPKLLYPSTRMQAAIIQYTTFWLFAALKTSQFIRLICYGECGRLVLRTLGYDIIRTVIPQLIEEQLTFFYIP